MRSDESLRAAVLRRLAVLEDLAAHGEADELLPLARTELHRLADGWRLLLNVHQPGVDGRCRACPGQLRRRAWPCPVWMMASQHLIGEQPPTGWWGRRAVRRGLARRARPSARADGDSAGATEPPSSAVTSSATGWAAGLTGPWPLSTDPWSSAVAWPGVELDTP